MEQLLAILLGNTVVALAIAAAALLAMLVRRPALAHVLWLLVLVKLVTPPVVRVPVMLPTDRPIALVGTRAASDLSIEDTSATPDAAVSVMRSQPDAVTGAQPQQTSDSAARSSSATPSQNWLTRFESHRMALLLAAWVSGSGSYVVRVLRGTRRLAAVIRSSDELENPAVVALVRDVAARLGLSAPPDVRLVQQAASPMVVGMGGRPLLLIPSELVQRLGGEALRGVIAHELAHLRRRDHWVRWIETGATAVLWWHPLLWLARRGLHEAEEQCCDAWVVWAMPDARRAYADALVTTAGLLSATPSAAAVPAVASGLGQFQQLRRRLVMIMDRTTNHGMSVAGKVVASLMLAAVAILPVIAHEQPGAPAKSNDEATALAAPADIVKNLQELIDKAKPGSEVTIPKGTWTEPLTVSKPLKLRGEDREGCVIEVTSDQPAIRFAHKGEASLENVTVRWKLETSNRSQEPQAAIVAKDGNVRLRNVKVIAADNPPRCPSGFTAIGFGNAKLDACEFEGFDFTVQFGNGAKGDITGSVVLKPGHCGITAGPESTVNVKNSIVAMSAFHGLRCTGGTLNVEGNLVVANKNRGIYLGNKDAHGTVRNNVIQGNGAGISAFSGSDVKVLNNFIAGSEAAAVDMRDTCRLKVENNLLANNSKGLVMFRESGKNRNTIGRNGSLDNKTESENVEPAPQFVKIDGPIGEGEFTAAKAPAGIGLKDGAPMTALWQRWTELQKSAAKSE